MKIRELLERDFTQPIEEIIKVNNVDEHVVHTELTEYVATDTIKQQYRRLFQAMADAPKIPTEGIGVWISGFFGSGKSSFAKNLGYVLANRTVLGKPASELFLNRVKDRRVSEYVEFLNQAVPTEVFMFDIQVDTSVQTDTEQIAEIMYRVLLRELDYAEDYAIAALEFELEAEGKLEDFQRACKERYGEWRMVRKGAQKFSRASALLHELDPATYPNETAWQESLQDIKHRSLDRLTVKEIVERSFDLCERRRPGKAFAFIIDEVGQYVARSSEKLENLRAVVEQYGRVSLERVKQRRIPGPTWVVVTSQEKLQQVYDYISSGRIDLPKLQDRFRHQVHMSPADIRVVASRRVLAKKNDAPLRQLFKKHEGSLLVNCKLERTERSTDFTEDEFVQFYPYLPHYIDLSIDIMTGVRQFGNAPAHLGGSNRTIIKQAEEMLIGDRTRLAEQPVGALVTLDKVYELVHDNIPTEKQKDIFDIERNFAKAAEYPGWHSRVAKVICLLEFVRDLPRTPHNIAALLIDQVGDPPPEAAVKAVLEDLKRAEFVRDTEQGWKLQTAQEKRWETEKRSYTLKRSERNEILRKALQDVFSSEHADSVNYNGIRKFGLRLSLDGQAVSPRGEIPFDIVAAEDDAAASKRRDELITESLQEANKNTVFWLVQLSANFEDLVRDFYASRQMIQRYEHLRSQNKINEDEANSLRTEHTTAQKLEKSLQTALKRSLEEGVGIFRGVEKEAADLGKNLKEIVAGVVKYVVPQLYPKLELGNRPLDPKAIEQFLTQANLNGLPPVFYGGDEGLNLIVKEGSRYVPNPKAEIAQEILDYLKREHSYGNKVTGKDLENHFGGLGYGWDPDIVRLALAVLFRANQLEVIYQGRRYKSYHEPQARLPFIKVPAFRGAGFAPREAIDLKTLAAAVRTLESLVGQEVDVEESAIAEAFRSFARAEREDLLPALATARAHRLPLAEALRQWEETLGTVLSSSSDDCVRMLAGEGRTLHELRAKAQAARAFLTEENLEKIRQARRALEELVPALEAAGEGEQVKEEAGKLRALLDSSELAERLDEVEALAKAIDAVYGDVYRAFHYRRCGTKQEDGRYNGYIGAIEEIKGMPEFLRIGETAREKVLAPLEKRAVEELDRPPFELVNRNTGATLAEMAADIEALAGLRAQAVSELQRLAAEAGQEGVRTVTVRPAKFFITGRDPEKSDKENFDAALERLREHVYGLFDEGAKVIWE